MISLMTATIDIKGKENTNRSDSITFSNLLMLRSGSRKEDTQRGA